ncbi:deleted in autism-related protein 1 isoform X1 [Silurus asotus]|uniref:Deleted in autism-related protein 1 isoform X1 n=1 Tax=Silurus asotus TaxID=30991 RepID=A0AAD5AS95_SILAS|nr:deleted in autism-related protein 1 isoform X1 [Silurus asotus]
MGRAWWHGWFLYMGLPLVVPDPSPVPSQGSNSFTRSFLGLDKCNACVGTSICKKLYKEQIRFERWLDPQLHFSSDNRTSYEAIYTDDSETWRPVVLSRLVSPDLHQLADESICISAGKRKSCSIEAVLRATPRFQNLANSNILLHSMVQGLVSPMLRCPSQRLLNRIVRRYFEVADVGSVQMKHFTTKDKLRLLYTMAVNQQPLILQMFPGNEGWPFPRYHGSCGRLMVWAGCRPLRSLYQSALAHRSDAAYQILHITQSLTSNSLHFRLYYTSVSEDIFGIAEDGRLFIMDASTIGIIDLQEGFHTEADQHDNHTDVFSCLSGSCIRTPPCKSIRPTQSFALLCRHVLPKLLTSTDAKESGLPSIAITELTICADQAQSDQRIHKAVQILKETLQHFRPCNIDYGYRYPECRYSAKF